MDPSGNMMSLHTIPHKKEYVLFLDTSMRQSCCVDCPLDIPELKDQEIEIKLDALAMIRETQPEQYDKLTKQLENDIFKFVGHIKNTLVYFGCKPMIKRGNQYLQDNIPGARIVMVVITDQLENKKIPEIAPFREVLKYKPVTSGPFGESIGSFMISN